MIAQPTLTKTDIRLVVLDVDHTLLNNQSELTPRTEQAIRAAMGMGVKFMLATGKNYASCRELIQKLNIDMPCIFTQGLTIHEPNGTLRHEQTLDDDIIRRVITYAEDRGFAVVVYSQGRVLARVANPYVEEIHTRWKEVQPEYVGTLQNLIGNVKINKLVLISPNDPRRIKALRWQLNAQIGGNARLMSGGVPHMLEVLPPNGSKGNALRALLKELKIDPKQVMAIGDGENDLEMIKIAGIGVAMANAEKILKDAADDITSSNETDGVAKAIEKHILGAPTPSAASAPATSTVTAPASATPTPTVEAVSAALTTPTPVAVAPSEPKPEDSAPQAAPATPVAVPPEAAPATPKPEDAPPWN
ncbi:MAG: Cof-type HAD-IIB family hydrolase [Phototrophicaceae bacterium]